MRFTVIVPLCGACLFGKGDTSAFGVTKVTAWRGSQHSLFDGEAAL
jgi:hypothetical protein